MAIFTRIVAGLRALFRKRDVECELDAELRDYLDAAIEQRMAAGMSRDEAVRTARAGMGSLEAVKDRVRDVGWESHVEAVLQDLRYAIRAMRRAPAFAAITVLTIAIGVGAATSMFGIMRNLLLAPPPHVTTPDHVFRVHTMFPPDDAQGEPHIGNRTSFPFYEIVVNRGKSFHSVAAYTDARLAVGTGPDARMARATLVSAGFWTTLGPRPILGRFIQDNEAHPATGSRVVVLGHAFWRRQFGGRRDVIGSILSIKGQPYDIIGVAPRGFRGIELADVDLWLPLFAEGDGSDEHGKWHTSATSYNVRLVARLKDDVAAERASAELSTLLSTFLVEAYGPKMYADAARSDAFVERNRRVRALLGPVTGGLGSDLRPIAEARVTKWLVGIAFLLLGIACSNVAGLLLLRAVARRREMALRLALGVSRTRLALQLLTESSLLALMGGVCALLTVMWGGALLQRTILPAIAWEPISALELSVVSVAALCVFGAALLAGMAPLWYARTDGVAALREGVLRGPAKRPRMLAGLLAIQGALTVVLLVGAGLFLRSLHNAQTEDIGLDRDNVLAVQIDFDGTGRSTTDVAGFFEQALERAAAIPGVTHASLTAVTPLRSARARDSLRLPGRDDLPDYPTGGPYSNAVTPGFFATTGMRLRQGRDFLESERNQRAAMIVNETLANLYWPDRSPIGECIYLNRRKACTTVVGVVADSRRFNIVEKDRYLYYYTPLAPTAVDSRALLVRMAPDADRVETTLRQTLHGLDGNLPFVKIETLGEVLNPQIRPWRLGASVFTGFGILAVILAIIGLWSSVAYAVSQRTQEFAVRMTLGAHRSSLVALMLREGVRDALIAMTAGLILAAIGSRYITDLLYGVSSRDPLVFITVAAAIFTLATIASLLPAWRVSRIDPAVALRTD
jgi:putative ABC transport system permease protein